MKKSYSGSCHCGAIRFEADVDLGEGTGKCNCSVCAKTRAWGIKVKPEDFHIVAGEDSLTDYQFNTQSVHHLFCKHCGVRPFGWADIPQAGGKYYTLNVACLDAVDIDELMNAPVTYSDGLNNSWWSTPAETRHL